MQAALTQISHPQIWTQINILIGALIMHERPHAYTITHTHHHYHRIHHAPWLFSKLIRPMLNRLLALVNRAIEKKEGQQERSERDEPPEKNEQTGYRSLG